MQPRSAPRLAGRGLSRGDKLDDVSFELYAGEVLGVVALEGQGQDELFDILAGSVRPSRGELLVDGAPVSFSHPADAIRAGVVYIAADRAEALLMQRSVRENIALPSVAAAPQVGSDQPRTGRQRRVRQAVDTLQIDARAGAEVRRLSGGNQQKVTIARWVTDGVRTMLCFDPTRGIDIRTKNQIYVLLRDLAEAGAAILLYTSELKEIQLVCDRAIVIFGGRVVAEIEASDADEPTLLRAAYNLRADAVLPEETVAAEAVAADSSSQGTSRTTEPADVGAADALRRRSTRDRRGGQVDRRGAGRRRRRATHAAAQPVADRADRLPGRAVRVHQADPAELRRHWHPGTGDLHRRRSPWPRSPRPSSSSRVGSTFRSAR